jgi:hypothetical protein
MGSKTTPRLSRAKLCLGVAALCLALAAACVRFELFASPAAAPSAGWGRAGLQLFGDELPLENIPVIVSTIRTPEGLTVKVANEGTTTLTYDSAGPSSIQLFQEFEELGKWLPENWDWCGTGKAEFELHPGEQVDLFVDFWDVRRERMLAQFTEKGSQRSGLVVLASEPGQLAPNGDHVILLFGAGAAACGIWLTVRAINRRERWASRLAVGISVAMPILYLLSIGPATWGAQSGYVSTGFFRIFYAPVALICEWSEPCGALLLKYVSHWTT